jgi:hypothetical protein
MYFWGIIKINKRRLIDNKNLFFASYKKAFILTKDITGKKSPLQIQHGFNIRRIELLFKIFANICANYEFWCVFIAMLCNVQVHGLCFAFLRFPL